MATHKNKHQICHQPLKTIIPSIPLPAPFAGSADPPTAPPKTAEVRPAALRPAPDSVDHGHIQVVARPTLHLDLLTLLSTLMQLCSTIAGS